MLLKTILNRVQKHGRFVYDEGRFVEEAGETVIEFGVSPRSNSQSICPGCGQSRPGYDTQQARRFEFVPLWGMRVFFLYTMRRVDCPSCGVLVEEVPWAQGKNHLTTTYSWFLARWAKRLSWKEVAVAFRTSWENVFRSVEMAVGWGRRHQQLAGIRAIGADEVAWQHGHHYLTLVYQIDEQCKRLLWIGRNRSPGWAGKFLEGWCTRTLSSRIEPMKKVARTLRAHHQLILNWFRAEGQISAGIVEGFNNKVKLTTRKAYGFRSFEAIEIALYHALGNLPEPEATHRFC